MRYRKASFRFIIVLVCSILSVVTLLFLDHIIFSLVVFITVHVKIILFGDCTFLLYSGCSENSRLHVIGNIIYMYLCFYIPDLISFLAFKSRNGITKCLCMFYLCLLCVLHYWWNKGVLVFMREKYL